MSRIRGVIGSAIKSPIDVFLLLSSVLFVMGLDGFLIFHSTAPMSVLCFCKKISFAGKGIECIVMQRDEFFSLLLLFFLGLYCIVLYALRSDRSWVEDARSDENS